LHKLHNLKHNVNNVLTFYTKTNKVYGRGNDYLYCDYPNVEERLAYIIHKILGPLKRHPEIFIDKTVLDFGCATGEHSYFLSHYATTVDCFDPQILHYNWLNALFSTSNSIKVLKTEEDCAIMKYDTIILSGVLSCIYDYGPWLSKLIQILNFKYLVLISVVDEDFSNKPIGRMGFRQTRLYDNRVYDNTVVETEILKATSNLTLFDSYHYYVSVGKTHPHKKIVHFYKK